MSEQPLIYIPDASYDNPDYYPSLGEVQAGRSFLDEISKKFQLPARETNIGAGADWPAVALEVVEYIRERDAVLLSIALFFAGKKINDNLEAWLSIGHKLRSVFAGCHAILNRSASIMLALSKFNEDSGVSLENIKLHRYETLDGRGVEFLTSVEIPKGCLISNEVEEDKLGHLIHYFKLEVNGELLDLLVKDTTVLIRKADSE